MTVVLLVSQSLWCLVALLHLNFFLAHLFYERKGNDRPLSVWEQQVAQQYVAQNFWPQHFTNKLSLHDLMHSVLEWCISVQ